MAHVVGVPRRDPCQKCQLPVFLAERLTVGKKVYHRTCLKCARCSSQLTPGSFYETEIDNEYCCETCPDEEDLSLGDEAATTSSVQLRHEEPPAELAATPTRARTVRNSIADRLAFFEQSTAVENSHAAATAADAKLLQKSVSDEEKTKSLKKMEATTTTTEKMTTTTPYKMNSALSSFLYDTTDGEPVEDEATTSAATDTANKDQMETSDSEEDELSLDQQSVPALPSTPPPMVEEKEISLDDKQMTKTKFTATAQLQLTNNFVEQQKIEEPDNQQEEIKTDIEIKEPTEQTTTIKKSEIQFQLITPTPTTANDNINNINNNSSSNHNDAENNKTAAANLTPTTVDNNDDDDDDVKVELESKKPYDNNYVTKEQTVETDAQQMGITALNVEATDELTAAATAMETELPSNEQAVLAQTDIELRTKIETQPTESRVSNANTAADAEADDVATMKRLSVVRARLHQFEVIANNVPDLDKDNHNKDKDNTSSSTIDKPAIIEAEENLEDEQKLKAIVEKTNLETEIETKTDTSLKKVPTIDVLNLSEVTELQENVENKKNDMPMELEEKYAMQPIIKEENEKSKEQMETVVELNESIGDTLLPIQLPNATTVKSPNQVPAPNNCQLKENYPEDLNPFQSDDDEEQTDENILRKPAPHCNNAKTTGKQQQQQDKLNPFDSSDDEIELEKSGSISSSSTPNTKVPPPRPPPPRISKNPFGDETEEDMDFSRRSSLSSSLTRKTPVPTPRTNLSQSQNPTPEPTPRLSNKSQTQSPAALQNLSDYYGSANSLSASNTPSSIYRNADVRGSNNSLTSSAGGTIRGRKQRKAPAPPPPATVKELFPSTETIDSSKASTPNSSTVGTPKQGRKKRHAPAPPKPARLGDSQMLPTITLNTTLESKNLLSYPLQTELDSKLSDEEKALLEGKLQRLENAQNNAKEDEELSISRRSTRRLIPLDASLLLDADDVGGKSDDLKHQEHQQHEEELNVVYRRVLIPPLLETPTHDTNPLLDHLNETQYDRQLEKLKDNKEAKNRNRQSQLSTASSGGEDSDPALYNKSAHGKWKRRKGPAPALPIPPRKVLQMLPLQEIKHELQIIEVQQQGLEKQGVVLEKMIRDRCEDENGDPLRGGAADVGDGKTVTENSKEVEDLILQLFELVNEKNELFRRQAELMYLRRQHRLEQEQADLEYEIRVLMAQPERNKTDSDKAREEALIARLVEVVQLRNEVIECLEMDRLREAEEDMSIKQRLELHTAQRENDDNSNKMTTKLSKKEKKKQKETKKLWKSKKLDADKDADESELNSADKQKNKKKKKKFIF